MSAKAHPHDDAKTAWPAHVGIGGVSVHKFRETAEDASPARALNRLTAWVDTLSGDPGQPVPTDSFPFAEILGHYQLWGRTHVSPKLANGLRDTYVKLPTPRSSQERILVDWLPSTFDQQDGDYDSYIAAPMLERLAAATGESSVDVGLDTEIVVLLADLLRTEGEALAAAPDTSRQRVRTHATVQALARVTGLSPKAGVSVPDEVPQVGKNDPALAEVASRFAEATLGDAPPDIHRAVEIALLPTTPLHDELMFIRNVQLFELVYRQMSRCLQRTRLALLADDIETAVAELDDAAGRVENTPALYRILTTMSRESFAVIRSHTDGRSAIQSRSYREVERISAPRPAGPVDDKLPAVTVPTPTLQEIYAEKGQDANPALRPVTEVMRRFDHAWRAMKRTHWGITLKIIGNVTGTGGTSGAAYLKTAAEIPLFPVLHEQRERGDDRA
ncbi:tryptophan 2,3-dioxygenase [Salinactinospora qingdaonensis]|uniref:Tryptophan 2,3-dioxygenase n=1 Tax=Salinactinospora qingdaonensis TaxID=702744 RepID=A0ABP7G022_9ACTN